MKPVDCADLYSDGRHYDRITSGFLDDLPFYRRRIEEFGQPVLELACGTGRLTIPLRQSGVDIDGIDVSTDMLHLARHKAREAGVRVALGVGDVRQFIRDRRYAVILYPFNAIAHIHTVDDFLACMGCVKRHLTPGGVLIVDMFVPDFRYLIRDPNGRFPVASYEHPDGLGTVQVTENNHYDPSTQINHIVWYTRIGNRAETSVRNNMKLYYPQEFEALFRLAGFRIMHRYGNYDDSPFSSDSEKQLLIVSPQQD